MAAAPAFAARRRRRAGSGDHRDLTLDQIRRQRRQAVVLVLRPPIFDRHVAAIHVTGVSKALDESGREPGIALGGPGIEEANHRHRSLLRARRKQP